MVATSSAKLQLATIEAVLDASAIVAKEEVAAVVVAAADVVTYSASMASVGLVAEVDDADFAPGEYVNNGVSASRKTRTSTIYALLTTSIL